MRNKLLLCGPFSKLTGYGHLYWNYIKGFEKLNIPFGMRPIFNHIPDYTDKYYIDKSYERYNYYGGIVFGYGDTIAQLPTSKKCIYTMYENTIIPNTWKSSIEQADCIITPSSFCRELFLEYNKNTFVCLPSINTELYKYRQKEENAVFTIGTAGVMSLRKGFDILIQAFKIAFGDKDDVKLIIKSRDTRTPINAIAKNIVVIDEDWSDEQMVDFYCSLDLYAAISRGEGLGYGPIEASLCGTPSIVTRWSGPTEYIDDKSIFGIDIDGVERIPRGVFSNSDEGEWAIPSVKDVVEKLIYFYNNRIRIKYDDFKWRPENAVKRLLEVTDRFLL